MRKICINLVAAAAVCGAADMAAAADMTTVKKAQPAAYNWAGFYFGGHAGYGWADHAFATFFADAATAINWNAATAAGAYDRTPNARSDGWLAGIQFGHNYQSGRYVFGAEFDISWTGIDGKKATELSVAGFSPSITTAKGDLDMFGTLRSRIGVLPSEQLLIYATGGLAFGRASYTYTFAFPGSDDFVSGSRGSRMEWGWTIGGGAEFAVADNWTAKVEYLYYDLGDATFQTAGSRASAGLGNFNVTADNTGHIARLGFNYRFGTGGTPAPK
jgi:outer membrane immunogenic protein